MSIYDLRDTQALCQLPQAVPKGHEIRFYTDELVKMEEDGEGSTREGATKVD